jgi:catechol 2,3-dioxygenase-like lactoylglutathione lyase family enzyme
MPASAAKAVLQWPGRRNEAPAGWLLLLGEAGPLAYRFMLEVPEVVHEDAKIAIGGVRDAQILIERHPHALNAQSAFAQLTVTAHSLAVLDALYAWMGESDIHEDIYLESFKGDRLALAELDAKSVRRRIQGDQYWMENTVPRIAHVDAAAMEGGARVADVPYGGRSASSLAVAPAASDVTINGVDHIAVRVRDMPRAEQFYSDLFGLRVIYRARRDGERWQQLPADYDYVASIHTGVFPEIARLENGPLGLVLINAGAGAVMHENRIAYVSVDVALETLQAVRGKALFASYAVQEDSARAFRFVDPFGVAWQLVATS